MSVCVIRVVAFCWHEFWLVGCESVSEVVVLSIFSRTKISKWGRVVTPQFWSCYFIESFYLFRVRYYFINCFHLVNVCYLSMFTFCRDLGAFAGKIERGVFWAFRQNISYKSFFLLS